MDKAKKISAPLAPVGGYWTQIWYNTPFGRCFWPKSSPRTSKNHVLRPKRCIFQNFRHQGKSQQPEKKAPTTGGLVSTCHQRPGGGRWTWVVVGQGGEGVIERELILRLVIDENRNLAMAMPKCVPETEHFLKYPWFSSFYCFVWAA